MTCDCSAYRFPHRPGGGACYVGKHCTFGESIQDVLLALMGCFGVKSSSDCGHELEVDESCVGCRHLSNLPINVARVAQNLGVGVAAANRSLAEISPGTRLVIGLKE
jgi:hypothetical protein